MSIGKSDILFVFPPAPGNIGAFKAHLGVAYLRAALARDGMVTEQYLNEEPGTIDAVAADIVQRKCPIVGFTAYDVNARLCIAIARSIKRQKPSISIVFGGPAATFSARPLMERQLAKSQKVFGHPEIRPGNETFNIDPWRSRAVSNRSSLFMAASSPRGACAEGCLCQKEVEGLLAIEMVDVELTRKIEQALETSSATSSVVIVGTSQDFFRFDKPRFSQVHQFQAVAGSSWGCVIQQDAQFTGGPSFQIDFELTAIEIKKFCASQE